MKLPEEMTFEELLDNGIINENRLRKFRIYCEFVERRRKGEQVKDIAYSIGEREFRSMETIKTVWFNGRKRWQHLHK